MRGNTPWKVAVGLTAVALAAAGCTSEPAPPATPTDGSFIMSWTEPQNKLIPAATSETGGGVVIDALFTGLTNYAATDAKTEMANADSITSADGGTTWTVKLKSGWKWHDGTPVTAKNYVDAWNYAAYTPNGMINGTFFGDIKGYGDVTSVDPDEDGPKEAPKPAKDKMDGLKVVDDTTFEVTLSGPSNLWPIKVGYSAFMPLPDVFFTNPDAFGANPIGNGPFKMNGWTKNTELKVTRFDEYQGADKPKVKDVTFRVYSDDAASYEDVKNGTIDFQQQIPQAKIIGDLYKADFPSANSNKPVSSSSFLAMPTWLPGYNDPKVRQAISMAIDRKLIVEKIFNNTRIPMNGWVNPNMAGYKDGSCGEYCTFDAAKAKALFDSATTKPAELSIAYNGDASHKPWVDAVCNSIQTALGVPCVGKPFPTFGEFRTLVTTQKMTGMSRAGWQADYPHIENWLNPLLKTGASSNDGKFSDAAFDAKLKEADGTADLQAAQKLYQDAEAMLPALMPTIPLWHGSQQTVWSAKLQTVTINTFGELDLATVTVK
ncbi:peptide ABC transporter substrate-binding protein [Catellatospora methionotrophica]|uniref:Peptide ABC transporter substrate-binding protein n=1 Tax=Catellatospora methionotrophica TaxID=121620 RepID=A0A8J3LIN2_9ACTN|nr:peptide ABC transporter substrate-binding protein [Catellatospora methionotrophica]